MITVKKLLSYLCAIALLLNHSDTVIVKAKEASVFDSGERTTLFNENWMFSENGSSFEPVTLPHDWSIDEAFDTAYEAESGFLPGGNGTYTKSVIFPASCRDKRILLEFEGVYQNAKVTVNGKLLGEHPYGYTSFAFDLSDVLIMDGKRENKIVVEVSNPIPGSRWYTGSGIYRDVYLTVTEKQYIDRGGVKIETPEPGSSIQMGHTSISVEVGNDAAEKRTLTLRTILLDSVGVPVSNAVNDTITLDGHEKAVIDQTVDLNNPVLWTVDNPVQYTCRTRLTDEDGTVLDSVDTRFGYRWSEFDAKNGFTLNGEPLKLKGVCLHHDFGALGAASMHAAVDYRLDQLKEMGVNAVRIAHNPADGYLLEACSKRGILVIEEAFDTWTNAKNHNTYDYSSIFSQKISSSNQILGKREGMTWSEFDIREMVRHSRNEPCVILYSIGNEILGNIGGDTEDYPALAEQLCEWVNELTDTRPVTIADNMTLHNNETQLAMDTAVHQAGGVIGLNYATAESMERYHSEHPKWRLFGRRQLLLYGQVEGLEVRCKFSGKGGDIKVEAGDCGGFLDAAIGCKCGSAVYWLSVNCLFYSQ